MFEVVLKKWVVLIKNVTKCEYLCLKMSILLVKSEYLLFEMGGNGINEESENLSWKVSIFNGKSWAFVLHLVFEMAVPLPAQFPLLVVFCGIKWKMNPKLVGNCSNLVIFEWNLVVFFLKFEWNVWSSGYRCGMKSGSSVVWMKCVLI